MRRGPGEALVRRVEPQELLDDGRRASGFRTQRRLERLVARQVQDGAADQRDRRDVRCDQQLPQAARDELVVERLAVDARREQCADRVLLRVERLRLARGHEVAADRVQGLILRLRRLDVEVRLRRLEALSVR